MDWRPSKRESWGPRRFFAEINESLSLYAKHLAWLNVTPEGEKKSRREELSGSQESSPFLILPDVEEASYIVDMWHECGTCGQGMSGPVPLTWSEIKAWKDLSGINISHYELSSIRKLSIEYVGFYFEAQAKDCPAPHAIQIEQLDRTAVSNRIKGVLSSFKKTSDNAPKYTEEDYKG